jgi:hypothetical protein
LALMGILGTNLFAAEAWYTCTINRIGGSTADTGSIYVRLTDTKGAFNNVSFKIPEARLNQVLAILLTAAANKSTAFVKADKDAKTLSVVHYNVD